MARPVKYRRTETHDIVTEEIIRSYERLVGAAVALPVPVEDIIERKFDLSILHDEIPDPVEAKILGALSPTNRTIVLNTNHQDLFDNVIGPERFTLAHELGHWVYDADIPGQGSFDFSESDDVFCRSSGAHLSSDNARREANANKFASALLLPKWLLSTLDVDAVLANFRGFAHQWGVSQQTLRIRLETLDLLDDLDLAQLDIN